MAILALSKEEIVNQQNRRAAMRIASQLKPEWQLTDESGERWLVLSHESDDGRKLYLDWRSGLAPSGMFNIHGCWPTASDGYSFDPNQRISINVGRDRPTEKQATDIQRRFCEPYAALYADRMAACVEYEERLAQQMAFAAELGELLGGSNCDYHGNPRSDFYPRNSNCYRVCVNSRCDVDIQLRSIPADLATEIAFLIGNYEPIESE